jgi:hypothetical protein
MISVRSNFAATLALNFATAFGSLTLVAVASAQNLGPSLSRPATAEKVPGPDGFLQRWLILEPIGTGGLTQGVVQAAVNREYFRDQLSVVPRDGETVKVEGAELRWHAVDTKGYNVNLYHLANALGKQTSNVLFWAVTTVNCPEELRNVRLAIGSNAASVWWVNGKQVVSIYGDRQTVIDDGVSKRLTLKKGPNDLRCVIFNAGGATDFCARFLDTDEKPLLKLSLSAGEVAK